MTSADRGLSSEYMAFVMFGRPTKIFGQPAETEAFYPYDSDDFGRCVRFLEAVPDARSQLFKLMDHGPVWRRYINFWHELEALYRAGNHKRLYELMTKLRTAEGD